MRDLFRRHPAVYLALAGLLLLGTIAWAVFVLGHALPPRRVVMSTGPEGGAYRILGERYREVLARFGVRLELRPSGGDVENLERLQNGRSGVSVGFVAGGLTNESKSPGVVSLGTIAYYPLWIFCRGLSEASHLTDLRGKRISIGPEGSGTLSLVRTLLRANELEEEMSLVTMPFFPSAQAVLVGQIDCACMLTTADAPAVQKLLADERVNLVDFARADAYVARYPYLRKVVAPEGVGSLAKNLPPRDVSLIAATTSLLVRKDLHPAIQFLLLQAADEIQSPGGIVNRPRQFPAPEPVDLPLSSEAGPFYKSGGSYLQRHLPFWLWVFTSRVLFLIIPILGILYSLIRALPYLIDLVVDVRLNRIYRELREIDSRIDHGESPAKLEADLRRLDERVRHMRVPSRNTRAIFTLRLHLDYVRERLGIRVPAL
jgi:TRAP transporter TAXI family solute receptor